MNFTTEVLMNCIM